MKLALVNGRYEGRLSDGRLLCVLPDVFEMNKGQFPEQELYNPQEWLSSVDGENCWIEERPCIYTDKMPEQSQKRGPGRPSTGKGRKPSLNVTISQEVADFLATYGKGHNVSGFIEGLIKSSLEWKYR